MPHSFPTDSPGCPGRWNPVELSGRETQHLLFCVFSTWYILYPTFSPSLPWYSSPSFLLPPFLVHFIPFQWVIIKFNYVYHLGFVPIDWIGRGRGRERARTLPSCLFAPTGGGVLFQGLLSGGKHCWLFKRSHLWAGVHVTEQMAERVPRHAPHPLAGDRVSDSGVHLLWN